MARVLAIDYGRKRIGLAISDPTGTAIEPYGFIQRQTDEQVAGVVSTIVTNESVGAVVVGLPLHAHGDAGEAAGHARRFQRILGEVCPVPIHEQDERHSSSEAEILLRKLGQWPAPRGALDAKAAAVILRRYLDQTG